jgi:hypothetical protein
MNYFKYYRLTALMNLNRKSLGFSAVFVMVYIFLTSTFFNESGSWTLGPSTLFIISLFTMSLYAHQTRFDPTNPMYQFPLTSRERTKYEYMSVIVVFLGTTVVLMIFGLAIVGIFALFGHVNVTEGEEVVSSFWTDAYSMSHHFLIFALMMPLSYLESSKKKYIIGLACAMVISFIHFSVYFAATGSLSLSTPITTELVNIPYYQIVVIAFLAISVATIFMSYKKSVIMNSYH